MSDYIVGREAIAEALGVSIKTVTRWHNAGVFRAACVPYPSSPMRARREEIERLRERMVGLRPFRRPLPVSC